MRRKLRHPIRVWRELNDYSPDDVAQLAAIFGRATGRHYVKQIESGARWPSAKLAVALMSASNVGVDVLVMFGRVAD